MNINHLYSRRRILKTLGVSSAFAPFIPALEQEIFAQSTPNKRYVQIFHPHGNLVSVWDQTLEPLMTKHRNKVIVFKGVRVRSSNINGAGGGHHFHQAAAVFSGSENTGGASLANGISLDQYIAQNLKVNTPFKSLVLGVMTNEANIRGRISHKGPSQPVTPEQSPSNLFNQLFANVIPSNKQVEYQSKDKSVLDYVKDDLSRLEKKISGRNFDHIKTMMDSIRTIEKQINPTVTQKVANCEAPNPSSGSGMDQTIDAFLTMIAHAFQCNLTNVASLQILTSMVTGREFAHLGINDGFHAISHSDSGQSVSDARNKMRKIVTYFYEKMASLMTQLEIPEPDGSNGTILDNTLILSGSELGVNTLLKHGGQNMPYVMGGGAGGALKTGQTVNVSAQNNQVLVTAAQAMGFRNVTRFGTLDNGSGPIRQVLA